MNQKEIIRSIANLTGLPQAAVHDVLATAAGIIANTLSLGEEDVTLPGLGKFKATRRPLRRMVLPSGQECQVGGKVVAKFVPSSAFRAAVNGEIEV